MESVLAASLCFFFYAAPGSLIPYLNIHYSRSGFSMKQVGALAMLPSLVNLFAGPLWAGIADALNLHKKLLPLLMALSILFVLLIYAADSFLLTISAVLLYAIAHAPVTALVNTCLLVWLGEKSSRFGHFRLWGSLGFGGGAWLVGSIMESGYSWAGFAAYALFMALGALCAALLPFNQPLHSGSYWRSAHEVFARREFRLFIAGVFLVGLSFIFIHQYFPLSMQRAGAGEGLIRLAFLLGSLSEVPFSWMSARLIDRFSSRRVLAFATVAFVLRSLIIAWMVAPPLGLVAQMLHGASFTLLWTSGVTYSDRIAGRRLRASLQAVFDSTVFGLAGTLGALFGGVLFGSLGSRNLFLLGAAFALLSALVFSRLDMAQPEQVRVQQTD